MGRPLRAKPPRLQRARGMHDRFSRRHASNSREGEVRHSQPNKHLQTEKLTTYREAQDAVAAGAKELDMVLNYPKLLAGDQVSPLEDVKAVRAAAPAPTVLKVIVETAQLDWSALKQACDIVLEAKADFIKTSTGFNGAGAQVDDVRFMREQMGANASVKASGGIRSLADCQKMIDAGADRIGASAGVAIMKEAKGENEGIAGGDGY